MGPIAESMRAFALIESEAEPVKRADANDRKPHAASVLRDDSESADLGDDSCMARAAQGDAAACRELVDRHLARIVAFAARTLGDPTEAEDVAQETFERMWSHVAQWETGRGRLTTWLHRVALNLCLDRLRKRREHPSEDAGEAESPDPGAADLLAQQEIAEHVANAMKQLTDPQRIAVTLCHYQGLRNSEAAQIMDLSVEAVESLLVRGRRSLRDHLKTIAPYLLQEG